MPALEAPLEAEELSRATPPRDMGVSSPVRIAPPSPSTENVTPKLKLPGAGKDVRPKPRKQSSGGAETKKKGSADGNGPGGKIPNIDDLTARFAALKR